jgi:hypothetical protein
MNDINSTERNEQMVRVMAVVGFVVLVCLLAWLAVQAVRFIPTAFSSLANIFEANQRDYTDQTSDEDDNNVVVIVDEDENENEDDEVTGDDNKTPDSVATSTPTSPATPTVTKPTPVQYKTVVTHKIPVSDPNGKTDLAVSLVTFGYMNASGRFVPQADLSDNDHGAIQFVVKNIGTKTSGDWGFTADLPNDFEMESKVQAPLKPSESSTLTIVFGQVDKTGNHTVDVSVKGGNDVNTANNAFRTTLRVK